MKQGRVGIRIAVTLALLAAANIPAICEASDRASDKLRELLVGSAVSPSELGKEQARGISVTNALTSGSVIGNSVGPQSVTGVITNSNSINNNVGITTVFQNTGNNSLFQSSTSIFISVH